MFRTQVKFFKDQTPEQRAAHVRNWRRQDAVTRMRCNVLQFWRLCRTPVCRRNHACCGDMHACFERHWEQFPESGKAWFRAVAKARQDGHSTQQAMRMANAEAAREAGAAAPQPDSAASDSASAEPRVRPL